MKVTDKQYFMEDKLKYMLDLMIERSIKSNFDNLVVVDGDEGYGKTNFSVGCAYYVAQQLNKTFNVDHLFFKPDDFIKYASEHENEVIVWDEAAMVALASEWQNKTQQKLMKFLMIARKKRHFYFFCIPKFFRLNEYFIIDRAIALCHVYARNQTQLGRFVYFKKESKNNLYYEIKRTKKRRYKDFYDFHGTFPEALPKVLDEESYNNKKDEAIMLLANTTQRTGLLDEFNIRLRYNLSQLDYKNIKSKNDLCAKLGLRLATLREWAYLKEKHRDLWPNP